MHFNKNKIFIILLFINFFYFFIGFIYQHDFTNGGKIDFEHIYTNFLLLKKYSIFNLDWTTYESTSLPLHYIITSNIIPENIFLFKLYNFILSLITIYLFFYLLSEIYKIKNNIYILILSSILMISSSFRGDSFFGQEEIIGYTLVILSFIFLIKFSNTKNFYFKVLSIVFACLAFYSRQTLGFLSIIIFFQLLEKNKIFCKNNFYLSLFFLILLLPSLYFFYKWGGPIPMFQPEGQNRMIPFQLNKIPIIFGMFIVFLFPLIFFQLVSEINKIKTNKNKFLKILLFFIIFFFIYVYVFDNLPKSKFGGGPLYKIFYEFEYFKIVFLFFSYLGLISSAYYSYKNFNFCIFTIVLIIIYGFSDVPFFSYLDPLMFIIVLVTINEFKTLFIKHKEAISLSLFGFFLCLHLSWVFYFKFFLGGIIR